MDLQRYVSPDLTHFVGRGLTQEAQFKLLKKIIKQGVLQSRQKHRRTPKGCYDEDKHIDCKLSSNLAYEGSILCFCDIPLADLYLHMEKYSPFGIAFHKRFLAEHGVTPVMYVPEIGRPAVYHFRDQPPGEPLPVRGMASQAVAFDRFWKYFNRIHQALGTLPSTHAKFARDLENVIDFLDTSVLSHMKFFDHGLPDDDDNNYYMEREWRTSKDVTFDLIDIRRIIIPTRFSRRLRNAFKDYDGEVFFAD